MLFKTDKGLLGFTDKIAPGLRISSKKLVFLLLYIIIRRKATLNLIY